MHQFDMWTLIAFIVLVLSSGVASVTLFAGIVQNHLKKDFRYLMSSMFLISVAQFGDSVFQLFNRYSHAVYGTPAIEGYALFLSTTFLAAVWGAFAFLLLFKSGHAHETIRKVD